VLLIKLQHLLPDPLRHPPVRRPSPLPMQYASIPFLLDPSHQPSHLSRAQPCYLGRFLLADLFLQSLTNQVESSDLMWFHLQ
jgi:hypothetical protein